MLKAHVSPKRREARRRTNVLTLSSLLIDGSLTLFSYVKYRWFAARLLTITDSQSTNYAAPPADTRRVCACTFYLVFKEPDVAPPATVTVFGGTLQSY